VPFLVSGRVLGINAFSAARVIPPTLTISPAHCSTHKCSPCITATLHTPPWSNENTNFFARTSEFTLLLFLSQGEVCNAATDRPLVGRWRPNTGGCDDNLNTSTRNTAAFDRTPGERPGRGAEEHPPLWKLGVLDSQDKAMDVGGSQTPKSMSGARMRKWTCRVGRLVAIKAWIYATLARDDAVGRALQTSGRPSSRRSGL